MNTPHSEQLINSFKEYLKDNKDLVFKLTSLLDAMFPWLVGISIAAITLIFSSIDKIKFVDASVVRVTLGLLTMSVILGIFSRICFVIANYIGFLIYIKFEMGLKTLELPLNPETLKGDETAEQISILLIEDFKFDMNGVLPQKTNINQDVWHDIDKTWRDFYIGFKEFCVSRITAKFDQIKALAINLYGYKENHFEASLLKKYKFRGWAARFLRDTSYIGYILSAIFLGLAVCYIVFSYIYEK